MALLNFNSDFLLLKFCAVFVVYVLCGSVYRLLLHPLAKFPGSKWAALTHWHEFYHDVVRNGLFFWTIDEMHRQHGPIIRVTPNELHINDPQMLDLVYAPSSKPRDKDPRWCAMIASPNATITTSSYALHKKRRSVLNPFFSKRAILSRENEIKQKVLRLCHRMEEEIKSGQLIHRVDVMYNALTTDIISDFAFGFPYGVLDMPDYGVLYKETVLSTARITKLLIHFPWLMYPMRVLPLWLMEATRSPLAGIIRLQHQVYAKICDLINKNHKGVREEDTIFQAILDSEVLSPSDKAANVLQDEAQTIMSAGSETTAKALSFMTHFLLRDKDKLNRLRGELNSVARDSDGTYSLIKLEQLPYLTACIDEAIRMTLGITVRSGRIAHEDLMYRDWIIPAGTVISMKSSVSNYNPEIFPDPMTYNPERWIQAAEQGEHLERWLMSFSKGSRMCVGYTLAYAEMYLTMAHVLSRFEMDNFETCWENDLKFRRDWFVGVPKDWSRGIRIKLLGLVN